MLDVFHCWSESSVCEEAPNYWCAAKKSRYAIEPTCVSMTREWEQHESSSRLVLLADGRRGFHLALVDFDNRDC